SSTVGHGCSTYSRPPAAESSRVIDSTAVSTSHAAFASMRTLPAGPRASRTAATRSTSAARSCPGSATLTFAVAQPDAAAIRYAAGPSTAGMVVLTRMLARLAGGYGSVAASRAAASHLEAYSGPYSSKGEN